MDIGSSLSRARLNTKPNDYCTEGCRSNFAAYITNTTSCLKSTILPSLMSLVQTESS